MTNRLAGSLVTVVLVCSLAACGGEGESESDPGLFKEGEMTMAIVVTSPAFEDGGMIPAKYTCDAEDVSPPLNIEGVPDGAQSLALISDDPDAPTGTWVHWVLYNLPPDTRELAEHMPDDEELPNGARHGVTDFRKFGYGGPCPPGGTHRYFFKIFALDTMLELSGRVTKADLEAAMKEHVLAEGQLMGKYQRRK